MNSYIQREQPEIEALLLEQIIKVECFSHSSQSGFSSCSALRSLIQKPHDEARILFKHRFTVFSCRSIPVSSRGSINHDFFPNLLTSVTSDGVPGLAEVEDV